MKAIDREHVRELRAMKEVWEQKAVLRNIYTEWYKKLSPFLVPGNVLEIGAGTGNFKEFMPKCISSDCFLTPWSDVCLNAMELPLKNNSLDNILCIDTVHHLEEYERFFREAERVLRGGGRIVMLEPYAGISGYVLRKLFHREEISFSGGVSEDAFEGNNALPTSIFYRGLKEFKREFPGLRVIHRSLHSPFLYPLSGGFKKKIFIRESMYKPLRVLEKLAKPFNPILAFKMVVVVEKC